VQVNKFLYRYVQQKDSAPVTRFCTFLPKRSSLGALPNLLLAVTGLRLEVTNGE
jgi:hypothetical protein